MVCTMEPQIHSHMRILIGLYSGTSDSQSHEDPDWYVQWNLRFTEITEILEIPFESSNRDSSHLIRAVERDEANLAEDEMNQTTV